MATRGLYKANLMAVEKGLEFNVSKAKKAIERQERAYWDLELRHPGGDVVYVGRWEDVPDQGADHYVFDPAVLPNWIVEELVLPAS